MSNYNKDGGIAQKADAGAKISTIPRKSLTAIPVPGTRKPEIFEAETIDDIMDKVPRNFKVELRRTDGSSTKEEINISSFADIELGKIVNNSETLKAQRYQQEFLSKLQNELTYNKNFRQEMETILKNPQRKAQLLKALQEMQALLKENKPPVLDFLMNL